METICTANLIATDKDKNILLVKRAYRGADSSLWSLPGGTKKENEKIEDTLIREIQEELGSRIKQYNQFKTYKNIYSDKIVGYNSFI
jgi:ADP-ribose pyrophosphatase YjhB (NUDIX family)